MGKVVRQHNGPVYELAIPIKSEGYEVKILRIRQPDPATPQRGHVDFVVKNYEELKKEMFSKYPGNFGTLKRPEHELLGLKDPAFNVKVYFIS